MSEPITLVLTGEIRPEQQWKYVYLPFDVPENIGRIDVAYSYDAVIHSDPDLAGGNTLDIGIFDSRGYEPHSAGYRGWTGSNKSTFFIAQDTATPGYMPGPIQPGRWNIILGPYKVAVDGCHYRVGIKLTPAKNHQAEFPPLLRVSDKPSSNIHADGWYKGELHCHTFHSDGDSSPEALVWRAESLGLDFLAVTDHNNRSQTVSLVNLETSLILIPGYEVTTFYGHWNIWGDNGWIDFRVQTADDLKQFIQEATSRGYLVSCNHPRPYGPDWAFPEVGGFKCVEVWNGPWQLLNNHCLNFWEMHLKQGERLTAVGGSDHHFSKREHIAKLGHPTNYIYSAQPPSAAGLLRAIRAGHVFVSESPTGPRLILRSGEAVMGDVVTRPANKTLSVWVEVRDGDGTRLELVGSNGLLMEASISSNDVTPELSVDVANTLYVRAQLINPATGDVRALTNPIYVE
ncbi:MAG: CehA/McbA family metallohydrolase [Chloroflexota bacterium]